MKKNLVQLLRAAKNTPGLGKMAPEVKESVRVRLMQEIENMSAPAARPTVFDYLRGPFHGIELRSLLSPLATLSTLGAVLLFSSGSVFASMNSVPGDALYGLKIAAERAQLTFADSEEMRSRLHIEFANRRAEEVSQLLETKHPDHEERVKIAMGNLKSELKTVSDRLSSLQESDKQGAVSLAKLMDRKVVGLEQAIDASLEGATDSMKLEAEEVKGAVKVAGDQAQSVINERADEVKVALEATSVKLDETQKQVEERIGNLQILSEEDRKLVAELKEMRAKLGEAQEKLAENEVEAASGIITAVEKQLK